MSIGLLVGGGESQICLLFGGHESAVHVFLKGLDLLFEGAHADLQLAHVGGDDVLDELLESLE